MNLKQNDLVVWDTKTSDIPGGRGYVKGFGTTEMPTVGRMVIVEVRDLKRLEEGGYGISQEYPYTSICIPECYLSKPVNVVSKSRLNECASCKRIAMHRWHNVEGESFVLCHCGFQTTMSESYALHLGLLRRKEDGTVEVNEDPNYND
jgi:hypothetical protein